MTAKDVNVHGDVALDRTAGKNGGAIKGDDVAYLEKRLADLPKKLDPYTLLTGELDPYNPSNVRCLNRRKGRWWGWLDFYFGEDSLVVRRCRRRKRG